MADVLNTEQITTALTGLPGWQEEGGELVRVAELADFPTAITVVDRVAELAEQADHHPDIDIRWRTLTFHLSTHSAGGITSKDIALAGEINTVISKA
ncbi:MAG TPA: 4a-hydroxytetrahydrobiopterin dehydratase [Pseudonocardiaceae bacterium]|jgi:4a-hydroxytetrahydrobiopterin dehydratase|nr:4a-hydroxytetrahydrobiopterin dehydratase [Pseudonocardiaceae bacterium]